MDQPPDIQIEIEALVELFRTEFPKEYTICVQRAHILKLEQMLRDAQS